MTEDNDAVASRPAFFGFERAPDPGPRAEQREQICGDKAARQMDSLSLSGEVDAEIGPIGGYLHSPALLLHDDGASLGIGRRNSDEPIRLGVWKGTDERAINEAEHRRVTADPKRQRKRGHHGPPGIFAKHPKAVAQVLPKISEHIHSPCPKNYGFMIALAFDAP